MFVELPHAVHFSIANRDNRKRTQHILKTAGQMRLIAMNANGSCLIFLNR